MSENCTHFSGLKDPFQYLHAEYILVLTLSELLILSSMAWNIWECFALILSSVLHRDFFLRVMLKSYKINAKYEPILYTIYITFSDFHSLLRVLPHSCVAFFSGLLGCFSILIFIKTVYNLTSLTRSLWNLPIWSFLFSHHSSGIMKICKILGSSKGHKMGGPLTSNQVHGPRNSRGAVKSFSSTEHWKRIHSELECYNLWLKLECILRAVQ